MKEFKELRTQSVTFKHCNYSESRSLALESWKFHSWMHPFSAFFTCQHRQVCCCLLETQGLVEATAETLKIRTSQESLSMVTTSVTYHYTATDSTATRYVYIITFVSKFSSSKSQDMLYNDFLILPLLLLLLLFTLLTNWRFHKWLVRLPHRCQWKRWCHMHH